jgi:hypothetical protein
MVRSSRSATTSTTNSTSDAPPATSANDPRAATSSARPGHDPNGIFRVGRSESIGTSVREFSPPLTTSSISRGGGVGAVVDAHAAANAASSGSRRIGAIVITPEQ